MIKKHYTRLLEENEFAFGPNTKTLLNFWTVLDRASTKLSVEKKETLNKDYYLLNLCDSHTKPFFRKRSDRGKYHIFTFHFESVGGIGVQLWCYWSSLEIIFTQDLLDEGHSLIFLPKLIQQLEYYGAL